MTIPPATDDAFESRVIEIYRAAVGGLFAATASWTRGDRGLAEDVVQESFLRAVRHWRRHGIPDQPQAWLRAVAHNLLVSYWRTSNRESPVDSERVVDGTPAAAAPSIAERLALADGLDRLEPGAASLLRSFHLEGQTVREIAEQQELSERAVEGRLRRARMALRRWLGSDDRSESR